MLYLLFLSRLKRLIGYLSCVLMSGYIKVHAHLSNKKEKAIDKCKQSCDNKITAAKLDAEAAAKKVIVLESRVHEVTQQAQTEMNKQVFKIEQTIR